MSVAALRVPLLEVFSSFQGEGPRVGERQIFVRLSGCDLRCAYCDTPESFPAPPAARVEQAPDGDQEDRPPNPVDVAQILSWIERLDRPSGLHRALSVTGGEPLLHPAAVAHLARGARRLGLRVHLETGGHRPQALARVLAELDEVTPDLKLESATCQPTPWSAHRATYELLEDARKGLAVKAVIASGTTEDEVGRAARFAATHLPSAPLILQPVTRRDEGADPPSALHLRRLHAAAACEHPDVRVIPQVHPVLAVR